MYKKHSVLERSFGEIELDVTVDGSIDRPKEMVDHMLTTAETVLGIDTIQLGLSGVQQNGTQHETQKCVVPVQFGDTKIGIEITFELKGHVSNRILNSIVYSDILPKMLETVGLYLGDGRPLTSPPAPLAQQPREILSDKVDQSLGLANYRGGGDAFGQAQQQSPAQRQQLAAR